MLLEIFQLGRGLRLTFSPKRVAPLPYSGLVISLAVGKLDLVFVGLVFAFDTLVRL